MELSAGVIIADRFRLIAELGEGGMGAVWRAQHLGLDIPCAVKLIRAEAAQMPEIRGRFEREAKAAASLRSPHVVAILDHGVWEGTPYIAMELLEGEDLSQRLARLGRMGAEEVASVIGQVARALSKAHAAGLVHRDLKPANIFLARDDDREIAKVLDFGIAKTSAVAIGGTATKTGSLLGTPYYMSPEQAQGGKVDARSDLWSLAVVVYECLTGQLPFTSDALGDLLMRIIVHPLPVPSQRASLPPSVDAWWLRAAARDPAQRFQSAKELADALAAALGLGAAFASSGVGRAAGGSTSGIYAPPTPMPGSGIYAPATPMPSSGVQQPSSGGAAFAATGQPLSASRPGLGKSGTIALTTDASAELRASQALPPPAKRSRAPMVIALVAVVGAIGGSAFWFVGRGAADARAVQEPAESSAAAAPSPPAPSSSPTAAPAPSPSVTVAPAASETAAPSAEPEPSQTADAAPTAPAVGAHPRPLPGQRPPTPGKPKPGATSKAPTDYGI